MRSALICIEPGDPILSRDEAKAHLRVDHSDDDSYIDELCAVATATLDGADGMLKRALREQKWRLVQSGFCGSLWLPLPPLISVEAVKYLDRDSAEQTVDAANYRVINNGTEQSRVVLKPGKSWPATLCADDAVRVDFTAGYKRDGEADVPRPIVAAAKLLIAQWYEQRAGVVVGTISEELPNAVKSLISNYRIVRL